MAGLQDGSVCRDMDLEMAAPPSVMSQVGAAVTPGFKNYQLKQAFSSGCLPGDIAQFLTYSLSLDTGSSPCFLWTFEKQACACSKWW